MTVALDGQAEKYADEARNLPTFANFSLLGVKQEVATILGLIGRVKGIFSTYSAHDISHVDAMLSMLDWLIPPSTRAVMTPVDWLMTVLAIYLHDLGMVVSSEEYERRMDNPKFCEFFDSLDKSPEGRDYLSRTDKMTDDEKPIFFYQEFIRLNHASRIREWITGRHTGQWGDSVKPVTEAISRLMRELPTRFVENLGNICDSHHKDNLEKAEYFPLCERYGNNSSEVANVQYAALMLRTADLLHITKDRTPSVAYKIIELSDPKGVDEWKKQIGTFSCYMATREFDPDDVKSHVIVVNADFSEERPFFVLTEYLAYADAQTKQSKRWADASQKQPDGKDYFYPWHALRGRILVEGNEPVPIRFELDKDRLLELLVGHTIYNDPTVAVREILQNAIDAVRYQHYLDKRGSTLVGQLEKPMGRVVAKWNSKERELIVEDNGIGMNLDVIKFHLMHVGASFYDTAQFKAEYSDFAAISKFGIGILTCFMVSDEIEIVTCQEDGGYRIRMSSVRADYLLKRLEPGDVNLNGLEPHGTRVRIRLRSSIDLERRSMIDIIRYWIVLPACEVMYYQDDEEPVRIGLNTVSEVVRHEALVVQEMKEESFEVISFSHEGDSGEKYDLAFAVRKGITPERNFVRLRELTEMPAVCIEGIRADSQLPGFGFYGTFEPDSDYMRLSPRRGDLLLCLLSVAGDIEFRTTVSRMTLERDDEYVRVALICARLLFKQIESEVSRIRSLRGHPVSQASTAARWMYDALTGSAAGADVGALLTTLYAQLPRVVIEILDTASGNIVTRRELISEEEFHHLSKFWTIESRLVDYLGIISRDLGRELSLNDFIGTLAPELRDERITHIVADAHVHRDLLLGSHEVMGVEFSPKNQQTILEWGPKRDSSPDLQWYVNELARMFRRPFEAAPRLLSEAGGLYPVGADLDDVHEVLFGPVRLCVAPIEGTIKQVWGINTRIATVLDANSPMAQVAQMFGKASQRILSTGVINFGQADAVVLLWAIQLFARACEHGDVTHRRYISRLRGEVEELWRAAVPKINPVLERAGVDAEVRADLGSIIGRREQWFDVSEYWMDWIKSP